MNCPAIFVVRNCLIVFMEVTMTATMEAYHRSINDEWVKCSAEVEACPKDHIKTNNPEEIQGLAEEVNTEQAGGTFANATMTRRRKPAPEIRGITGNINDDYPYPQANDLEKVDTVLESINKGATSATGIGESIMDENRTSTKEDARKRDGHYYAEAAGYLGFVEKSGGDGFDSGAGEYIVSDLGRSYLDADPSERAQILRAAVNNMPAVQAYRNSGGGERGRQAAAEAMHDKTGDSTSSRRANTVQAWVDAVDDTNFSEVVNKQQSMSSEHVQKAIVNDERRRKERADKRKRERAAEQNRIPEKTCNECFMAKASSQFEEGSSVCNDCLE